MKGVMFQSVQQRNGLDNNANYECFKWLKHSDNGSAKLLCLGWILFVFISFPLIIFYLAFIGHYQDYPSISFAYFAGAIISILISIYAAFCFRFLQKMYKMNIKIRNDISELFYLRSKIKRKTGNLLAQTLKLKQEKEYIDRCNIRLKAKLKLFSIWKNKEEIKKKLMSSIKRTENVIFEREKLILINAYNSTLMTFDVNQLKIKQFALMMTRWPKRYKNEFIKSGKSFKDFNDKYNEKLINYDVFNKFMDDLVIEQVRNGIKLPGLS